MGAIKQSTTYTVMFLMVLSSDHISPATGKTVTVNLSKAGAAFAAAGGTVTEVANGWYKVALTTTDTNTLGDLAFNCTATSCDNTDFKEQVIAYDPTDAVRLGLSALPNAAANAVGGLPVLDSNSLVDVDVKRWLATAVAAATAGVPDVNVKNYNNVAAATDANNLPKVDVEDWKGTALPVQATAGIPDVNVKNYNNLVAQTDANNLPKVDVEDWKGTAPNALLAGRVDAAPFGQAGQNGTVTTSVAPTTTAFSTNLTTATAHFYSNWSLLWLTGANAGQQLPVSDYAVTNGVITLGLPCSVAPSNADTFILMPEFATATTLSGIFNYAVEGSYTLAQVLRGIASACVGNYHASDGTFRAMGNDGTTRISSVDTSSGRTNTLSV